MVFKILVGGGNDSGCIYCDCTKFTYSNNDNCTLECQIFRKIYENE